MPNLEPSSHDVACAVYRKAGEDGWWRGRCTGIPRPEGQSEEALTGAEKKALERRVILKITPGSRRHTSTLYDKKLPTYDVAAR